MSSTLEPSRQQLRRKAQVWRVGEKLGLLLHRLAPPSPMTPSAVLTLPTTISPYSGNITIQLYTPPSYDLQIGPQRNYPLVVNFHGGGFTLGAGTDDCRWTTAVVEKTEAVVASVDYRLAPEYPFPTAVEDGVDAILWLVAHANELRIDPDRIAISGFSAGGNLCFTVLLRLHEELQRMRNGKSLPRRGSTPQPAYLAPQDSSSLVIPSSFPRRGRSFNDLFRLRSRQEKDSLRSRTPQHTPSLSVSQTEIIGRSEYKAPTFTILGLISWYPPLDYRHSRADRRATNLAGPTAGLPSFLTTLFDASYLHPSSSTCTSLSVSPSSSATDPTLSPYCSPAAASDTLLSEALPENIMIYTCEYDDLRQEALDFAERLKRLDHSDGEVLGTEKGEHRTKKKRVCYSMIRGVGHGWDKSPNPLWAPRQASELYEAATVGLRHMFGEHDDLSCEGGCNVASLCAFWEVDTGFEDQRRME